MGEQDETPQGEASRDTSHGKECGGGFTYKQAGVDVAAGNAAVELLKQRLKSVKHPLVLGELGGFGGAMRLPRLKDPVLVAGTDGVGTKILIAQAMGRYDTIGIDLVAMSVNDVSACGAVPLFFLDYIVTAKVEPEKIAALVGGVDEGCLRAQCVLLGGETAEHPGHFKADDDFDMAGFAVGIAERDELWGPAQVVVGDVLIGVDSHGLHSNGFSLVRRLLEHHGIDLHSKFLSEGGGLGAGTAPGATPPLPCYDPEATVGDVLLTPTAIYSPVLHDLGHAGGVHAAAHVTGGGFPDNVGRAVPHGLAAEIDLGSWTPGPEFLWLHALGVAPDELLRTFNCGIGLVLVVAGDAVERLLDVIARGGHGARVIGAVVPRGEGAAVRYRGELRL